MGQSPIPAQHLSSPLSSCPALADASELDPGLHDVPGGADLATVVDSTADGDVRVQAAAVVAWHGSAAQPAEARLPAQAVAWLKEGATTTASAPQAAVSAEGQPAAAAAAVQEEVLPAMDVTETPHLLQALPRDTVAAAATTEPAAAEGGVRVAADAVSEDKEKKKRMYRLPNWALARPRPVAWRDLQPRCEFRYRRSFLYQVRHTAGR